MNAVLHFRCSDKTIILNDACQTDDDNIVVLCFFNPNDIVAFKLALNRCVNLSVIVVLN